jgi:hypothetical protein
MDATDYDKNVVDAFQLPESPASVNVKFWIDDYGVMLTMRSYKVADVVEQLEYVIKLAKKKGWKPTWDKEKSNVPPKKTYTPRKTSTPADPDAPFCPVHNRPMKKMSGRYGEFWKCTAKIGDNEWCNKSKSITKES